MFSDAVAHAFVVPCRESSRHLSTRSRLFFTPIAKTKGVSEPCSQPVVLYFSSNLNNLAPALTGSRMTPCDDHHRSERSSERPLFSFGKVLVSDIGIRFVSQYVVRDKRLRLDWF